MSFAVVVSSAAATVDVVIGMPTPKVEVSAIAERRMVFLGDVDAVLRKLFVCCNAVSCEISDGFIGWQCDATVSKTPRPI